MFSYFLPFRWTEALGPHHITSLGPQAYAYGVSGDGSVVVGSSSTGGFIWRETPPGTGSGPTSIINPPGFTGYFRVVSADGLAAAMQAFDSVGSPPQAFRWTEGAGTVSLGTLPGTSGEEPEAMSADGTVIVGGTRIANNPSQPFRWFLTDPQTGVGTITGLGLLPGTSSGSATAVSADGTIVVGFCGSGSSAQAFRWGLTNPATGAGTLSALPASLGPVEPAAMSADGSVVVGKASLTPQGVAVVWTALDGWRRLSDVLVHHYGIAQPSWILQRARAISADGRNIVGFGIGQPQPLSNVWLARLSAKPCYADCNTDGVLNLADLGCFQTRFALFSAYADCDGDGVKTLADFACFLNKFAAGCP